MNVKHVEHKGSQIGVAIRQFRGDLGLTQAQLAVAVGIAPTSIYRYEAGLSAPDVGVLQRLYFHAMERTNIAAERAFFEAICERTGLDPKEFQKVFYDPESLFRRLDPLKVLKVAGKQVTPREQLLTIAFILMIRNNTDEQPEKMMRLLIEPFMKEAKKEFDSLHKEAHDRAGSEPGAADHSSKH